MDDGAEADVRSGLDGTGGEWRKKGRGGGTKQLSNPSPSSIIIFKSATAYSIN